MITVDDYVLRPLQFSDEQFMYETMKDFPVTRMTLAAVRDAMSLMLHMGEVFDEANVVTDTSICMVLEYKGTPVSFRFNKFENNVCDVVLAATHPDHRGQGHFSAQAMMFGIWYFEHLGIDECYLELVDTDDVNATAANWRSVTNRTEETRQSRLSDQMLSKLVIRPDEFRTRLKNHAVYADKEYMVGERRFSPEIRT